MNKRHKGLKLSALLMTLTLTLSGCVSVDSSGNPSGWFYTYFAIPTQTLINWLAGLMGNNYGFAIIVLTVIIRLLLLPLTFKQQRSTTEQQIRMQSVQDVTAEIQEELQATDDPVKKQQLQTELSGIYQQAGISLTGGMMGCLPLLIQLPIISMVFYAIRYSSEIASSTFLGVQLGEPNIIFAIVAGAIYLLQAFLMLKGVPEEQRAQMRMSALMSPIMIFIMSLSSPSGVALYWIAGGVIANIQSFYTNQYYKPRLESELKESIGDIHVERKKASPTHPTNPTDSQKNKRNVGNFERKDATKKGRRNEGKQNR